MDILNVFYPLKQLLSLIFLMHVLLNCKTFYEWNHVYIAPIAIFMLYAVFLVDDFVNRFLIRELNKQKYRKHNPLSVNVIRYITDVTAVKNKYNASAILHM